MAVHLTQADSTGWMAMYCLNLLRIALELANTISGYESIVASKFFEHFLAIVEAMNHVGSRLQKKAASACGTTTTNGTAACPSCPTARRCG